MKRFFPSTLLLCILISLSLSSMVLADSGEDHLKNVTAFAEVFGDGQKVTAVILEYDTAIDTAKLTRDTYSVDGKNITRVYSNTEPAKTEDGINGYCVIIELATDDTTEGTATQGNEGNPPDNSTQSQAGNNSSSDQNSTGPGAMGGPALGETQTNIDAPISVSVKQIKDITTTNGQVFTPDSGKIVSTNVISPVVDSFLQLSYTDPQYGKTLMYNLYVPEDYDPGKTYPMVLFIHDAGAVSTQQTKTLTQGLGAVIWATPEEQAKHECFVLAPQYDSVIVNDSSKATEYLDVTVDLVNAIADQYSIDKNRIYTTGQSMGCMSSIAMDIKYPDLFAASLLVAGQWDPSLVAPMAKQNLWIVVSEGDTKAHPGMDNITAVLESNGGTVTRGTWNAEASPEELASDVSKMEAENTNIKYTLFEGGDHRYTWQKAYGIEGLRDWLFTQVKTP